MRVTRRLVLAFAVLAPVLGVACADDAVVEPPLDGGADGTAPDDGAPPTDAAFDGADASESFVDDADAGDASDAEGGTVFANAACGLLDASAADDGLFYDVGHVRAASVSRHGARLLSSSSDRWMLWDLATATLLARGAVPAANVFVRPSHAEGVVLVPVSTTVDETRSSTTGAVLHTFTTPAPYHLGGLARDGLYVARVTDDALELALPDGTPLRTIATTSLKTPDARPFTYGQLSYLPGEIRYFDWRHDGQLEVIPVDGSATRIVSGLPLGWAGFTGDGSLTRHWDPNAKTTTFADANGVVKGAGISGYASAWGAYAWASANGTLKLYSIATATPALLGTYPATHTSAVEDDVASDSGWLLVGNGVVSLRGGAPVFTSVPTLPLAGVVPSSLSVDALTSDWAIGDVDGRVAYGGAATFAPYGRVSCGRLRSLAAGPNVLAMAFGDRIELVHPVTGAFVASPVVPQRPVSSILVSDDGSVLVTDEPAAYVVATGTKIATWTPDDGAPLDVSADGSRVALVKPGATVDIRATQGGALVTSYTTSLGFGSYAPFARFAPSGTRILVVRDVMGPGGAGQPVFVTTDVHDGPVIATWSGYFPGYWADDTTIYGESLPSGSSNPATWDVRAGTFTWNGVGPGVSTPGDALGTRATPTFTSFVRRPGAMLYDRSTGVVRDLAGANPPWNVPRSVEDGDTTQAPVRADFAGSRFFWSVVAGVRRHAF